MTEHPILESYYDDCVLRGTPATNLDGGLLHSQKKELKGKLSFNTTASEADIPRLADQSTSDVLTSSGHSTSRSTHLWVF